MGGGGIFLPAKTDFFKYFNYKNYQIYSLIRNI